MKQVPEWMYQYPIAHRGYFDADAPENSLKAFQQAIDCNFAIELDVQMLKDGTLIVFHDKVLNRMTKQDGFVKEQNYSDIKDLTLMETSEKIPTFEEVLNLIKGQVPLMVEFKNESHQTFVEKKSYELLKNYKGDYIIQSFNPMSLLWFKRNASHIVRGQLSCRHEKQQMNILLKFIMRNVLTNWMTQPHFVIYDIHALDSPIIKWLKWLKKPLFSYTAKTKEEFLFARNQGIPAVFEQFDPRNS
ncbi:MAG: glycerophosphodiester phosphodiesterase [Clostridia bacterium]|nr:glycerophosphodiester phosphodiesterase [Clostridia bacterium]